MNEVLSVKGMQNAEKMLMSNGETEQTLMQKAVNGIFKYIDKSLKTVIVCGGGNNGGDGFCLAVMLKKANVDVSVVTMTEKLKPCAKVFFEECCALGISVARFNKNCNFSGFEQIVDCMFGVGFHGNLTGDYAVCCNKINRANAKVVSVDIPSGLNGDTGLTSLAVKSDLTVAVGKYKLGNLLNMAKDYIKDLVVCDIGVTATENVYLFDGSLAKDLLKKRDNFCHKGNFGYVGLMGGSVNYSGAIKLAQQSFASLRAGAGVSRLIVPNAISNSVMPYLTVSTLFEMPSKNGCFDFDEKSLNAALEKLNSLCIGMGACNTPELGKIIEYVLKNYAINLVIDADGLNALSLLDLSLLKRTKCKVALTPHLQEFSRITGLSRQEIIDSSMEICKAFAKEYNVTLLLKGTASIVCDKTECYVVNSGASGMATAGSGDVLSGIIVGLLGYNELSAKTVALGAFINGKSGEIASEKFGNISMTALDTLQNISTAICSICEKK